MEELDFQIIANLLAGSGEGRNKLDQLTKFLDENKMSYDVLAIDNPTPISILPDNGRNIKNAVICIGGDGTVSESIGYIINNNKNIPLLVVPNGTANFIAKSFGIENRKDNYDFLLRKKLITVDVGVAEYANGRSYFMLGFGLGFEERFISLCKDSYKSKFGILSYIFAAFSELLSLKKIPISVKFNDCERKIYICTLMILNTPPVILKLFPLFKNKSIALNNGLLNLQYVEYTNYFHAFCGTLLLHILGNLNFGTVVSVDAKQFALDSSALVNTQVDGELKNKLPVKVSILPKRIDFWI